jgi:hypothetical protein
MPVAINGRNKTKVNIVYFSFKKGTDIFDLAYGMNNEKKMQNITSGNVVSNLSSLLFAWISPTVTLCVFCRCSGMN